MSQTMYAASEVEVEQQLLEQLVGLGYELVEIRDYNGLTANLRKQLARFNQEALDAKKGSVSFSDAEFARVLNYLECSDIYQAAKVLRDQFDLRLDNDQTVYLSFLHPTPARNIFQVAHQIKMERSQQSSVLFNHRYDITILINGLPLVQIELKRPGIEIEQALNQINRYRKHSLKGLFTFLQIFVISNWVNTKYCCNQNRILNDAFAPIAKGQVFFWSDVNNQRISSLHDFTADFLKPSKLCAILTNYMIIKSSKPELMVMRPYQIYAVEAACRRVLTEQQNGYVFACTGSGKTLTSFKLAQLLRDESSFGGNTRLHKIIFLVDRKDLDDQTISEYNSFEQDCVDRSDSTSKLVRQLKSDNSKLIVTTIQKLACALKSNAHRAVMAGLKDKKLVFIIDECHRSQFGKMNADIKRHFTNALYIGFTGTPIFEENKSQERTTADIFSAGPKLDPCLHRYMIKDAIQDKNVLPFSVEHKNTILGSATEQQYSAEELEDPDFCRAHQIDRDALYHNQTRIEQVAQDILAYHDQKTQKRSFTAMFAVDSIATLGRYYDLLKNLNAQRKEEDRLKIAAIFSYQVNEEFVEISGQATQPSSEQELGQELLARCMSDYNDIFGTAFSIENFDSYRKDIVSRMKHEQLPQVDLLLVVDMMLTGFDAKPLNTLYLDKTLQWHGLLQAYSRTNRIDTINKQCGQIVTYRNIKQAQDNALRLFSGNGDPNEYLIDGYEHFLEQWQQQSTELRAITPTPEIISNLESEEDLREFVTAFKKLPRTLGLLMSFSQFDWKELATYGLSYGDYADYKSRYIDLYNEAQKRTPGSNVPIEVDYEIELVCIDYIDVAYLLRLLEQIRKHPKEKQSQELQTIRQELDRSDNPEIRRKHDLIETFVVTTFPNLDPNISVPAAYEQFEKEQRDNEIRQFAVKQGLATNIIVNALADYEFKGYVPDDDLRQQLQEEPYHFGLLETTKLTKGIKDFVLNTALRFKDLGD